MDNKCVYSLVREGDKIKSVTVDFSAIEEMQSRLADAEKLIDELATWVFGTVSQLGFEELQTKIQAFKDGKICA